MALNPLSHPGAYGTPMLDIEKQQAGTTVDISRGANGIEGVASSSRPPFSRWNARIEALAGLEARGISRVLPEEKHAVGPSAYVQIFAIWFGMNLCAISLFIGLLGPTIFQLGWTDCVCIVIFANVPGCCAGAYTATFGPESGHRAMVLGRFFMGYWPAKLACLLNIIMQTGWGILACIIAGQMISAVNGHGLSVGVGCAIAALCVGVLCIFGIAILHVFERYAWGLQAFSFLVLIGSCGRHWDTSLVSAGDAATITADRCSFFALVFASVVGYSAISSDFFVYYPQHTNKPLTFALTGCGIWTAAVISEVVGVGIATGIAGNSAWAQAYDISGGALIMACYEGLGGFGGFCGVLIALGAISNVAPSTYVAALSIQALGRYVRVVPRWVLCLFIMCVQLACSVAGRNSLYNIFENFLPIMAYWVCPWLTIVIEEHVFFHVWRGVPFDWTIWEDSKKLPLGAAAMTAWLVGWAGAVIGMAQVWYTGPIAKQIGGYGGDVGGWISIAFAGLVYPPLRWLELKIVGR